MPSEDYRRIAEAIQYLQDNVQRQPGLDELARALSLSSTHTQRLFARWAGVSPKRFLQCLTVEHAKQRLEASHSVLDTTYDLGLSGPGRLHDLFISLEAVTPGEYKSGGKGLEVTYGACETPFGWCMLGMTARGVCALSFLEGAQDTHKEHLDDDRSITPRKVASLPTAYERGFLREAQALQARWSGAQLERDDALAQDWSDRIFGALGESGETSVELRLCVQGTNFQAQVWRALLRLGPGQLCTYGAIARAIGKESAARAVGNAVGANPIAILIPCHRVIRETGVIGHYRWGQIRKRTLIAWEGALQAS